MRLSGAVQYAFRLLILPAVVSTIVLYLYPAVQNCHFPAAQDSNGSSIAPFRLLALGDPQLEGDTSLPDPNAPLFPSLLGLRSRLAAVPSEIGLRIAGRAVRDVVRQDVPRLLNTQRKKLDLLGNDYYLAHIYRTTRWWTQPSHVTVLGDLLGSQWISDSEFDRRTHRFWSRAFAGAENVPASVTGLGIDDHEWVAQDLDDESWSKRLINIAGNHDIGYAGDIDHRRIQRFEKAYGPVNWRFTLRLPSFNASAAPSLDIVILNSMNLDTPAWQEEPHHASNHFLSSAIRDTESRSPRDAVVLLTHIPLEKSPGVCVDAPYFSYFNPEHGGGIREQNHLSEPTTHRITDGFFGYNRSGIVLNGHDHEGCDTWHHHHTDQTLPSSQWNATKFTQAEGNNGVREITVRSMMGAYGGNAGLLSAWFDTDAGTWRFEYATCVLGVQHIWWAVHVLDLVVLGLGFTSAVLGLVTGHSGLVVDREKKER